MRGLILTSILPLVLGACSGLFDGSGGTKIKFDGQSFRGSGRAIDRADRRDFTAVAGPASRSMEGVREAVRYQGTKYCIRWFGVSEIDWEVDPQAEVLPLDGDKVVLRGRCVE